MKHNRIIHITASLALALTLSLFVGIFQFKYGRLYTSDYWILSLIGLVSISYFVIVLIKNAITDKKDPTSTQTPLIFKSNQAAFSYSCKFLDCDVAHLKNIPALVLDVDIDMSTPSEKGIQTALLNVASRDGGFIVPAQVQEENIKVKKGDFVNWVAYREFDDSTDKNKKETMWIGFITNKLQPIYDIGTGWRIK